MRIDIWATQREQAEVLSCGMRVLKSDPLVVKMWYPKATNPCCNFRFRSEERRDSFIQERVQAYIQRQGIKQERKISRAGDPADYTKVKPGMIFSYSWGYDQTNAEYWQVVSVAGQMATIREIGHATVKGSEGFDSERVQPDIGAFLASSKPTKKRILFENINGEKVPYFSMKFGRASVWNGLAQYSSWYA